MKVGRFILLAFLLLTACLIMVPVTARAASAVIYLRSDLGPGDNSVWANQGDFAPICNGTGGNPRLPGLDLVRKFAGNEACPGNTDSNRFSSEPNFILLVDDTASLSSFLTNFFQSQNLLQQVDGRQVIAPGIKTLQVQGQPVNVLFVGEMAYRQGGSNPTNWFTALNTLRGTALVAKVPRTLSPYMTECSNAANDVPLPPDWKNDRAQNTALGWQFRGLLPNNLVLAATTAPPAPAGGVVTPVTEVWAYSDPKGVCMALPRKKGTGGPNTIELLGIICQSERTGKACFWDNIQRAGVSGGPPAGTRRRDALSNNMKISDIQGGPDLSENCTNCHRGNNVFLVPNGSLRSNGGLPLSLKASPANGSMPALPARDTFPSRRYQPLSSSPPRPNWVNPPRPGWGTPPSVLPLNGCSSCHEIPALTQEYCSTVLFGVLDRNLMPPGGNWRTGQSLLDVNDIADRCQSTHSFNLRNALNIPPRPPQTP